MEILYTITEEGALVFAEKGQAEAVAKIHHALKTAKTWGEFKQLMDPEEFRMILEDNMDLDEDELDLEEAFDPDEVPGYVDGFYPDWLQAEMVKWFPKDLRVKYGVEELSLHNGEFLEFPAELADKIADELRSAGHVVAKSNLPFR